MSDPLFYLMMAAASLTGLAIVTAAALAGWRGWLQLQHLQLDHQTPAMPGAPSAGAPSAGARIEIADLKERIRKLEAIAAGVDL